MKNHHWKICLIVLLTFFILACNKNESEQYIISGKVYDPNLSLNVDQVSVVLSAQKVESGSYNSNYSEISRMSTAADGLFSFMFKNDYYASFKLSFEKSGYFPEEVVINPEDVTKGEDYSKTYSMYPEAYFRLVVQNNNPFDALDVITYHLSGEFNDCMQCCGNGQVVYEGEQVNYESVCRVYGNTSIDLNYIITKDHQQQSGFKNIFCTAFDTTSYYLLY